MRYDKAALPVPAKQAYERLTLSRMRERGHLTLLHTRPEGEMLVCGEGMELVETLPTSCEKLFAVEDTLYCFETGTKSLYDVHQRSRITGVDKCPIAVIPHYAESGARGMFVMGTARTYDYHDGTLNDCGPYGGYGAMHRMRLFFSSGTRIYFTRPFCFEKFTATDPDGFGYIELKHPFGECLAVMTLHDRVLLIAERGLVRLRADGRALDFIADFLPYPCGKMLPRSVAMTGEDITFFTDRGMWRFDGSDFKKMDEDADGMTFLAAASFCGTYYAAVERGEGRALLVYDDKGMRFVPCDGLLDVAAGEEVYLLTGKAVYRLTEKGAGIKDTPCGFTFTLPSEKYLLGVRIVGSGEFSVQVGSHIVTVEAGRTAHFHVPPTAGEIAMTISSKSEDCSVGAVDLYWGEDNDN